MCTTGPIYLLPIGFHTMPVKFAVGFASLANAVNQYNKGDHRLQPHSLYKNAGADGRDLGADIVNRSVAMDGHSCL
jgi:hypothetical protein